MTFQIFFKNKICLLISFLLIVSCSHKNHSQVKLKGRPNYYKNNYQPNTSVKKYDPNINIVTIKSGDNLYEIAKRYNVLVRDIIDTNNLQPPYTMQVGRKLKLPSTRYHTVTEGENLYMISRYYGINVNKLININNLKSPYNIARGSRLKISQSSFNQVKSSKAKSENISQKDLNQPITKNNNIIKKDLNPPVSQASSIERESQEVLVSKNNKFIWPVKGKIISTFGQKSGGLYNDGINIKVPALTSVKAVEDGLVAYVGNELRGYGNLVIIKHSDSWISAYAHLQKAKVKIGDKVKKGYDIASVGSTGNVDYPQLYFGIRKGKEAVDPQKYLQN